MSIKFLHPSNIHNFLASSCLINRDKTTDSGKQSGQTSIEYILLLAVVVFMITTIMKNVKNRFIAEQTPCPISDKSLGCMIARGISSFGTSDANFRYFQVRR